MDINTIIGLAIFFCIGILIYPLTRRKEIECYGPFTGDKVTNPVDLVIKTGPSKTATVRVNAKTYCKTINKNK